MRTVQACSPRPTPVFAVKPNSHRRAPSFGDVVAVRFPLAEFPDRPGDKCRPGVVLEVRHDGAGAVSAVQVAYTTCRVREQVAASTHHGRLDELLVLDRSLAAECGLDVASAVVPGRSAWLPWNPGHGGNAWFAGRRLDGSPFLGRLPATLRIELKSAAVRAQGRLTVAATRVRFAASRSSR